MTGVRAPNTQTHGYTHPHTNAHKVTRHYYPQSHTHRQTVTGSVQLNHRYMYNTRTTCAHGHNTMKAQIHTDIYTTRTQIFRHIDKHNVVQPQIQTYNRTALTPHACGHN